MTVISVPFRLRVAAASLLLCVPLVALEVLIVSRAPAWNLPYRRAVYWAIAYALVSFPLASWIVSANRLAYSIASAFALCWVLTSAFLAARMNYPALGFFTVAIFAVLCVQLYCLFVELRRSFFDPQLEWYQGLPSVIPGLICLLEEGDARVELRVSRLDQDGAFVFCKSTEGEKMALLTRLAGLSKVRASFRFRSSKIHCLSKPILMIERGGGLGIQFVQMSGDSAKQVGDFVAVLRGEGYV